MKMANEGNVPDQAAVVHHVCHELSVVSRFRKFLLDVLKLVLTNWCDDWLCQRLSILFLRERKTTFVFLRYDIFILCVELTTKTCYIGT